MLKHLNCLSTVLVCAFDIFLVNSHHIVDAIDLELRFHDETWVSPLTSGFSEDVQHTYNGVPIPHGLPFKYVCIKKTTQNLAFVYFCRSLASVCCKKNQSSTFSSNETNDFFCIIYEITCILHCLFFLLFCPTTKE